MLDLQEKWTLNSRPKSRTPLSLNSTYFDPRSPDWTKEIPSKVSFVELSGLLDSRWTLDLLQSVTNLHTVEIFIAEGLLQLSHPVTGLFMWPNLYCLRLDDVNCHARTVTDFLYAHKATLFDLFFQGVMFVSGSWCEPLRIMGEMPNLEHLYLCVPHERTRPSQSSASFDRFSDFSDMDAHNIHLHNNGAILVAFDALLHDSRTTFYKSYPGDDLYRVDFRLARAVIEGRAEIRDGECYLLGEE
jgi:hypothetical protein